jgi:hypothetical protein
MIGFCVFIGQNPPRKSPIYRYTPPSESLMDHLPVEILQLTFEFFVADGGHLEDLYLVSKRWRDAAVGYSKLWSYIHISREAWRLQYSETSLATRVRNAVIESEGNHLHVTINTRTWGGLPERPFTLALQECGGEESTEMWRWETLNLDLGDWVPASCLRYFMPQLRELTYRATRVHNLSTCFRYTAALTTLHLNGDCSTTWPATIRGSVQHLHINSNASSALWHTLQQFTSISSLFLIEMADLKHVSKNETICLSKLRELCVAFPEYGFPFFQTFLQLPSLTDLTLYTANKISLLRDHAKDVSASFAGILHKLEKLTITHMGCSSADTLREILYPAAHLKVLVLNGCGRWENQDKDSDARLSYPHLRETFYHVLDDPLLCPMLVRCFIEGVERHNLVTLRERYIKSKVGVVFS